MRRAFTLTEMMVSILIVGLITATAVISVVQVRIKNRDTQRLTDIKTIQSALEAYYRDENQYPATLTLGQPITGSTTSSTYLAAVPNPPTTLDGNCTSSDYVYSTANDNHSYTLQFCIAKDINDASAGNNCATSAGIAACWECGNSVSYGGESYSTVLIGTQCWFAQNLNIGDMVTGVTEQTDNSVLEKYCYNDNASNECATYGGLYQWDEAMQYSVIEGAQGVCPSGWHIPSDAEQNTLDQYLNDTTCDAGRSSAWDCANAGTKLQVGGISGFESLLAGDRGDDGIFYNQAAATYFWSSTINGLDVFGRYLYTGDPSVFRYQTIQDYGFSVRCIKN